MPTISERLRELDRKVLREDRIQTAEGWTKAMSGWRWALGTAVFNAIIVVAIFLLSSNPLLGFVLIPFLLLRAFQAGAMKTEHDRITGTGKVLGKRRPEGL